MKTVTMTGVGGKPIIINLDDDAGNGIPYAFEEAQIEGSNETLIRFEHFNVNVSGTAAAALAAIEAALA